MMKSKQSSCAATFVQLREDNVKGLTRTER